MRPIKNGNIKINKLPIRISTFNKKNNKVIPISIFTNPSHYISTKTNKNQNSIIPLSNKRSSKGKYIKKIINEMKPNKVINNNRVIKYSNSLNKKNNLNTCNSNSSKEKILHIKSINKDKENTQNNFIVKKIPTIKKKPLMQIIRNNNIIVKNGIKNKNLNYINNIGNLSYNNQKIVNMNAN